MAPPDDLMTAWSCINDYLKPAKRADPLNLQICYAESRDGLKWTKPNLGLCSFKGSKRNNIILDNSMWHEEWAGNLSVFKDENPDCPRSDSGEAAVRPAGGPMRLILI